MDKGIYYRLPCDQYGQPTGQIEKWRMTYPEYRIEKAYDLQHLTALWFDTYEAAAARADN